MNYSGVDTTDQLSLLKHNKPPSLHVLSSTKYSEPRYFFRFVAGRQEGGTLRLVCPSAAVDLAVFVKCSCMRDVAIGFEY